MGKKSRLKRESVRYSDAAPELPSWVIAPLSGVRPVRDEADEDTDVGSPDDGAQPREATRASSPRERVRAADEAVPEA
jgi:hypothetical protein